MSGPDANRSFAMKIAVIGCGYVGLVTGACLSDFGHSVACVDVDSAKVEMLRRGESPLFEFGLRSLLERNLEAGRLSFSTDLAAALDGAAAVFIAVGTPTAGDGGQADLTHVMNAAAEIARAATGHLVVVTKSTVPVGTNRRVAGAIREANPELEFDVASNPEFLREGTAIEDFMEPDRVVIGVETERAGRVMEEIYKPLQTRDFPMVVTDLESAEMIKYAANAFLAVKITFANEIAALCEATGASAKSVSLGMGLDARIGREFLRPGPGFGGSCFPKDTRALASMGRSGGSPMKLTETVIEVNAQCQMRMVEKCRKLCGGSFEGKTVGVLGITFKAGTDDVREAPALTILPEMQKGGASIRACDPKGREWGEGLLPGVSWADDPYDCAAGADLLAILTEWNDFTTMNLERIAGSMATPRLADLRNVYSPEEARAAGFAAYEGVGQAGYLEAG